MAVQDHLKIAAGELLRAANALRLEIDRLRTDEANLKQLNSQQIAEITSELRVVQHQANQTSDSSQKANAQQQISNLTTQLAQKKHELDDESKRIASMIRSKEAEIAAIESQARNVSP